MSDFRKEAEELVPCVEPVGPATCPMGWNSCRREGVCELKADAIKALQSAYAKGVEDAEPITRKAFNEGFGQGMKENRHGGYSWQESKSFVAIRALIEKEKV